MRYILRQKMLSLGDDFVIRDEAGREMLEVKGKVFSLGKQLAMRDPDGESVLTIAQQLLAWGPTYVISNAEGEVARVRKLLRALFSARFSVERTDGVVLEASGDFMAHEYVISRGEESVASISKQWFTMTDTYGVEIAAGEDAAFLLAGAVVIDMVCHPDQRQQMV